MQTPLFRDICSKSYGTDTPAAYFRAMFMNKPARKGNRLQWHQDRWTDLDRDPLITIWTALDPTTVANGCVKIIPQSHRWSLINPESGSGFLNAEQINDLASRLEPVYLELQAGEVILLHNWLLHSSEVNKTDIPRRAFSVCATWTLPRSPEAGRHFPLFLRKAPFRLQTSGCGLTPPFRNPRFLYHFLESGTSIHLPPSRIDSWLISPGRVISIASWIPIGQDFSSTILATKSSTSK